MRRPGSSRHFQDHGLTASLSSRPHSSRYFSSQTLSVAHSQATKEKSRSPFASLGRSQVFRPFITECSLLDDPVLVLSGPSPDPTLSSFNQLASLSLGLAAPPRSSPSLRTFRSLPPPATLLLRPCPVRRRSLMALLLLRESILYISVAIPANLNASLRRVDPTAPFAPISRRGSSRLRASSLASSLTWLSSSRALAPTRPLMSR